MNKRAYLRLIAQLERAIGREWLALVRRRVEQAEPSRVRAAITAYDLDALVDAAGLRPGDLTPMLESIRSGYVAAAMAESERPRLTFDINNPTSRLWLERESSRLVVDIMQTQREALRVALERTVGVGIGPRDAVDSIIGVMGSDGKRRGGIVGLHKSFENAVAAAREDLNNLSQFGGQYMQRKRRDKRFDALVEKAMDKGEKLSKSDIRAITAAYSDNLLQLRGETIARTEAIRSVATARSHAWQRAVVDGEVDEQDIQRTWSATLDARTRHIHETMDGQVRPMGVPFEDGDGNLLRYPSDPDAPAYTSINCRCMEVYRIDYKARYEREAGIA